MAVVTRTFVHSTSRAVAAICAVALTGCAVNPIAQWSPPTQREASPVSLEYARNYAQAARLGYQKALNDQVQMTASLNSGLLGLGALATALAVSSAHRDAVVGTAFIGGTAYAFGQQNLNKQRLLIYQAGVDAIGCANRAVTPLAMFKSDIDQLDASLQSLEQAIQTSVNARAVAGRALQTWNATGPETTEEAAAAQSSLTAAAGVVDAANKSLTSGRQLTTRVRQVGDQLVNAVDRIDAAVVRAALDTLPDPSSVFKAISGLAGFAGSMVPGAGVDTFITSGLSKRGESLKPQSATVSKTTGLSNDNERKALAKAVLDLNTATESLAASAAGVNGRLLGQEAFVSADELKDCGVSDVNFPLKAFPERVPVPAGTDVKTSFLISGGTPPYFAKLQFTPVTGVSVQQPAPFDSTVGVDVTKDAKEQSYPVLVMDSSKPTKTLTVQVEVGTGGVGTGANDMAPNAGVVQRKAVSDAEAIARAINDKRQFNHAGIELTVSAPASAKSESEIAVSLRCKPKPAQCIPPAAVASAMTAAIGGQARNYQDALKAKGSADCICPK